MRKKTIRVFRDIEAERKYGDVVIIKDINDAAILELNKVHYADIELNKKGFAVFIYLRSYEKIMMEVLEKAHAGQKYGIFEFLEARAIIKKDIIFKKYRTKQKKEVTTIMKNF